MQVGPTGGAAEALAAAQNKSQPTQGQSTNVAQREAETQVATTQAQSSSPVGSAGHNVNTSV